MNLENLSVTELDAQEMKSKNAGDWGSYLFDLYYGLGADEIHGKCGEALNGCDINGDIDASISPGTQC